MKKAFVLAFALATVVGLGAPTAAAAVDPAMQAKIDAQVKTIQVWASDPAIVNAVKAQNANPPAAHKAMTQEKWASLTGFDPFVLSFTGNPAAAVLKAKKDAAASEAFISAADGTKVAFLAKTTSWIHKGKPKHDVPMTGKTWQGEVETDQSTGLQQIQVAVPVLDGGKAIGSVVVGLQVARLK
jgi:hypothetical protein